jgi:hypothetical protein
MGYQDTEGSLDDISAQPAYGATYSVRTLRAMRNDELSRLHAAAVTFGDLWAASMTRTEMDRRAI